MWERQAGLYCLKTILGREKNDDLQDVAKKNNGKSGENSSSELVNLLK